MRLSLISRTDLLRLDGLAAGGPLQARNLGIVLKELAAANGSAEMSGASRSHLVVASRPEPAVSVECLEAVVQAPPEGQNPVDQVAACYALLCRLEQIERTRLPEGTADLPYGSVQRKLSHLLIAHPVLLDSRVLFGIPGHVIDGEATDDWVTLACALAELSFASLPRMADGLAADQLQSFAANPSVQTGLSAHSPRSRARRSRIDGMNPVQVASNVLSAATRCVTL